MTNRTTFLALTERVEAATGPDRALDADVMVALGKTMSMVFEVPRYTGSIDAAASAMPAGWGLTSAYQQRAGGTRWSFRFDRTGLLCAAGEAATEPLARLAAALRAHAEEKRDD